MLIWPRWFANPYLPRLMDGLRQQGIEAFSAPSLLTASLRLRPGDWVHLHWPGEALTAKSAWLYRLGASVLKSQLLYLKRRGIRIAWTAHNLVPHDDPHPELGFRARQDLLAIVDHVFVHFAEARKELADAFGYDGPCTVTCHPNYIDDYPAPPSRDDARTDLGLPSRGFVALAFGRIRPYKGVCEIIEAFELVAGDDDRLIIAGCPEGDVSEVVALAEKSPKIILDARNVPSDEVSTYFAAADAAVIGHRDFFTSGSAILALSMGCPVVGPNAHHLTDLAGGERLFVAEPTVSGLADGLTRAREAAPAVNREVIRAWAEAHGSWQSLASAASDVFTTAPVAQTADRPEPVCL